MRLKLFDKQGKLLSENFYWMGNKYRDYTALQNLPKITDLAISKPIISKAENGQELLTCTIANTFTKTPAVGIRVQLLDNKGAQILPAIFNDGYFTLMPGEKKVLQVEVDSRLLKNGYHISAKAFND